MHYKKYNGWHRKPALYCLNTFQSQSELKNYLKEHAIVTDKIVCKVSCELCIFSFLSSEDLWNMETV